MLGGRFARPFTPASLPGPSPASNGEGRIRTSEGVRRQIYSLLPLATRAPPQPADGSQTGLRPRKRGLLCLAGEKLHNQSWRRDLNPRPADYKSAALPLSYASPAQSTYYSPEPGRNQVSSPDITPQLVRFPLPSASQRPTWDTLSHAPAPRLAHRRGGCSYQGIYR